MSAHKDRVVLAYSGGLDTSVAIGWIGEQTGREVVTVAVDVGQSGEDGDGRGRCQPDGAARPGVCHHRLSGQYEFYNLGIGDPVAISAASRLGIGDDR